VTGSSLRDDPIWQAALDWLLRIEASPADARLLAERDAWLAKSAAHARAYRKAEKVWRLTGEVPPAHGGQWADAAAAPRRPAGPGRPTRRLALGLAGALAACLVIAAVLPPLLVRLQADYATDTGETRRIALQDGSAVHLDADSAVTIDYAPERRAVGLLAGQAFFQVASSDARPFTVAVDEVVVTVVGTAFDVQLAGQSVAVSVQTGLVRVRITHGGQGSEIMLAPGERLAIDRATGSVTRNTIEPAEVASWRGGRLVVDGATVAQVIEELRRYHPGMIVLRDGALAGRRVTGVFDLHDPAGALRAAVEPHAGRVVALTPYLLLVAPR
jgi:transmembrane sensor